LQILGVTYLSMGVSTDQQQSARGHYGSSWVGVGQHGSARVGSR